MINIGRLELDEITYSQYETIRAFRDYYRFLVELYMDESLKLLSHQKGASLVSRQHSSDCLGRAMK